MFEIGGLELLIIVLVALVVLGPDKLPDATLSLARAFNKIKKNITLLQRALFTEIALKEEQEKENKQQSLTSSSATQDEAPNDLPATEKALEPKKRQNTIVPQEENKK